MTKTELQFVAGLLRLATDEFSNHGCNDFEIPNTPENMAMMVNMLHWNAPNGPALEWEVQLSDDGKTIYTMDTFLMGYLAHLAEDEAKGK